MAHPLSLIGSVILLGHAAAASPRIEMVQPWWNFGTLTNSAEIRHDFIIRNIGDANLEISRVVSGCDACLRVHLEKTSVPPGGSEILHSRLDLRLLNGPFARSISIYCNDPNVPLQTLELSGTVVPAYQITPAQINLDLAEESRSAAAEIIPLLPLRAPLTRIRCENTNVLARLSISASNCFILTIQALAAFPTGRTNFSVTLWSTDTNDPPCSVRVIIHNPPDLEIIPARLRWQAQDEPQVRIVWVKQRGPAPWILLDAIAPPDQYHCEIDPDPGAFNYRIYVTARQLGGEAGRTNLLILKMRNQRQEEQSLLVPVSVEKHN